MRNQLYHCQELQDRELPKTLLKATNVCFSEITLSVPRKVANRGDKLSITDLPATALCLGYGAFIVDLLETQSTLMIKLVTG